MIEKAARKTKAGKPTATRPVEQDRTSGPRAQAVSAMESSRPPVGHPDYEFPKEVHNLLVAAQTGHIQLSSMADTKASILMGATFVVFGMAVSQITEGKHSLTVFLLAGFSFLATVFSVLAVRPKLMKPSGIVQTNTNLVFFGAFSGIPEEEYIDRIIAILRSEESTYRVMARDLYQNGWVLQAKKYRYLSYAYNTFLIGIGATLLAFLAEFVGRMLPG